MAITLSEGAKSIFTGMLMALEMSGGPRRVLLSPTVSSNRSGSGDLTRDSVWTLAQPVLARNTYRDALRLALLYCSLILNLCGMME